MKRIIAACILSFVCTCSYASHITGGEMYYQLLDNSGDTYRYRVYLKLFMRCNSGRQFNNPAIISIFSKGSNNRVRDITVPMLEQQNTALSNNNKCITDPPSVCYDVGYYTFEVELPASVDGYVIACQVVYRIAGISNFTPGYGNVGATYTAIIPGTSQLKDAPKNNSAQFVGSDLVVMCANNSFTYSFAAQDVDGDQLRYSFAAAYDGGTLGGGTGNTGVPATAPPYISVPYGSSFGQTQPLGSKAKIDEKTGLIKGIAPEPGIYSVTVQVEEIRNGYVIAIQRKDLQIHVTNCSIAAASIEEEYKLCRETFTIDIENSSTSPLITSQLWQVSNTSGSLLYSSGNPKLNYTFADTGQYAVKLYINKGQECADSAEAIVKVYPGFKPAFTSKGVCLNKPTLFTDNTSSVYGKVNAWKWELGEPGAVSDKKDVSYTYVQQGMKQILLTVSNTVGCEDTISKQLLITDKPPLDLAFKDTLICYKDSLFLKANGAGNYSWSPSYNINNSNSATPFIFPKVTTLYVATLEQEGCINKDSVWVRVTDNVELAIMKDSVICEKDPTPLSIVSNAFKYQWSPSTGLNNSAAKIPITSISTKTTYTVNAFIGTCMNTAKVTITPIPYPYANAGADTVICYDGSAQLKGAIEGSTIQWTPSTGLSAANITNPIARPLFTTAYVLTVYNNAGCPKPFRDTMIVNVRPDVNANAGRDTVAVIGQPLHLKGSGGVSFKWSPANWVNDPNISDPIFKYPNANDNVQLKLVSADQAGCIDSAFVHIKVFNTRPQVFVPTAFTPNSDGKNDLLKPIPVGIRKIDRFMIYDRWGQLIYASSDAQQGWDGTRNGKPQSTGTFVWTVSAVDHEGRPYIQKGTVVLLR